MPQRLPALLPGGLGHLGHRPRRHGDYTVVDTRNCLPLPPERSFVEGAMMACAAGTAFSSVGKLAPTNRDALVVFGLGPVGLLHVLFGRAMGARVIGVDVVDGRRALAERIGAAATVDAKQGRVAEQVRELTGGRGATIGAETSGSKAGQHDLVDSLGRRGRATFVGMGNKEPSIAPAQFLEKQITLMGSYVLTMPQYSTWWTPAGARPLARAVVTHTAAPAGGGAGLRPRGAGRDWQGRLRPGSSGQTHASLLLPSPTPPRRPCPARRRWRRGQQGLLLAVGHQARRAALEGRT